MIPVLVFWLLVMHALCDYPLQGDFLGQGKARIGLPTVGMPWWICLLAHCLIQAGGTAAAFLLAGFNARTAMLFGVLELILHTITDFAKIMRMTGPIADQALHVLCKAIYVVLAMSLYATVM